MPESRRALVAEAIAVHRAVLETETQSHPRWPIGLPAWEDQWVCVGLADPRGLSLSVWRRAASEDGRLRIPLPEYSGRELDATIAFPAAFDGWDLEWNSADGVLTVNVDVDEPSARVLRLTPR